MEFSKLYVVDSVFITNTTLKMYNKLQAKTAARAWVSSLLH